MDTEAPEPPPALDAGPDPLATLQAVVDELRDGVLLLAPGGTIRGANAAAEALFSLGEDAVGTPFVDVGVDYRLGVLIDGVRSSGGSAERDIDLGAARTWRVRCSSIAGDGGVVVVVRDLTRLRRLETVRRDFVANVGHELRTPVTAIQLLAETLQNGALSDPVAAAEFVGRIRLEVSHMAQIVEELLELSTIESGQRPIRPEPVTVEELFEGVERLRPLAAEREVTLTAEVAPGTPLVLGDPPRLGQVLRNLVHNAIKFTPAGGAVTVTSAAGDEGTVVLRVADTGVGIAPENLPRIFERFWKADRSRRRSGEGSGLGLAIARHVVKAHGGQIAAASQPGVGTTFTVTLPAAGSTAMVGGGAPPPATAQ